MHILNSPFLILSPVILLFDATDLNSAKSWWERSCKLDLEWEFEFGELVSTIDVALPPIDVGEFAWGGWSPGG